MGWFGKFPLWAGVLAICLLWMGCASSPSESEAPAPVPDVVTTAVPITPEVRQELDPSKTFQLGIEREERENFPNLRRRRLTLFVTSASVDSRGRHTIEILNNNVMLSLATVVLVDDETTSPTKSLQKLMDGKRRFRVYRLTRDVFRSANEIVADSDAVVWDIPLNGSTNSLEASVLGAALEKASLTGIRFIVLDRPTLMRTDYVDGPLSDLGYAGTLDAFLPIPVLPGMTAAELARLFNETYGIQADLTIQTMSNWKRSDGNRWLAADSWSLKPEDEARLDEVRQWPPFQQGWPELSTLQRLLGDGLFAKRTVTIRPDGRAELVLHPTQVPPLALRERLDTTKIDGLEIEATPEGAPQGTLRIRVVPDAMVALVEASLTIRRAAAASSRQQPPDSEGLGYRNASLLQSLSRGLDPAQIKRRWSAAPDYRAFLENREKVLLYQP